MNQFLFALLAGSMLTSCSSLPVADEPVYSRFQSGDIIVVSDGDKALSSLIYAQNDGRFSHAAIVVEAGNDSLVAVHIHGDKSEGKVARISLDRLVAFADEWAVVRPRISGERRRKAAVVAGRFAEREISFDSLKRLESNDRMYCSELVWKAYLIGAGYDLSPSRPEVFGNRVIPVDHLWVGDRYEVIYESKEK